MLAAVICVHAMGSADVTPVPPHVALAYVVMVDEQVAPDGGPHVHGAHPRVPVPGSSSYTDEMSEKPRGQGNVPDLNTQYVSLSSGDGSCGRQVWFKGAHALLDGSASELQRTTWAVQTGAEASTVVATGVHCPPRATAADTVT
jgi:hypothetical protein